MLACGMYLQIRVYITKYTFIYTENFAKKGNLNIHVSIYEYCSIHELFAKFNGVKKTNTCM